MMFLRRALKGLHSQVTRPWPCEASMPGFVCRVRIPKCFQGGYHIQTRSRSVRREPSNNGVLTMEFSGEYRIPARQQRVWNALSDPAVLQACIAGCSRVEKISD